MQDGVTEYTIETTSEDVSLKIKGHDLEYVTFEYTDKVVPGYSKRFTPSSTDDHTTISFPVGFGAGTYKLGISDQSMSTNAGRYTNIKLTIKVVEPANKTALQEQIEEAEDRNENYYTADTWTKLQEALTSAKAVNDDDSASQTEVDEATSALDNESQEYIKKTIDDLVKDHTVIIVAHRLSTIIDADTIHVIEKGKLAGSGTHKKLLKECSAYQNLYTAESEKE